MSTSYDKTVSTPGSENLGYETTGGSTPSGFVVPSCTVEDVDRAVFTLFKEKLPLFFSDKKGQLRVPVIFATGERFAILTRKKPLRDPTGAIILPLISITRTGLDQGNTGLGAGQTQPIKIKRRLAENDVTYQAIVNADGINNAVDIAAPGRTTPEPNELGTRRRPSKAQKNIYETITIAPTRFFKATYDITLWCDYTQQLNSLISVIMLGYHDKHGRTFKLETPKGYWFVAKAGESFSADNNFDNFVDDERLVRSSFSLEVPGYTIEPNAEGQPGGVRSFLSSPEITFDVQGLDELNNHTQRVGAPNGDPDSFTLQDLTTLDDGLLGNAIGGSKSLVNVDARYVTNQSKVTHPQFSTTSNGEKVLIKSRATKKGETVFRGFGKIKFDDLT
jgi:hypothetical protein